MSLFKNFWGFLILLVTLSGCTSVDDVMKSYLGAHKNDLLANWGAPQNIMSDGSGGEVWIYAQNRQYTSPGYAQTNTYGSVNSFGYTGNSYTTYTAPQTSSWTATRTFFINSNGIIYRYAWRGY